MLKEKKFEILLIKIKIVECIGSRNIYIKIHIILFSDIINDLYLCCIPIHHVQIFIPVNFMYIPKIISFYIFVNIFYYQLFNKFYFDFF